MTAPLIIFGIFIVIVTLIFIIPLLTNHFKTKKLKQKELEKFTLPPLLIDFKVDQFMNCAELRHKLPLLIRVNGELDKSENYTIHFRIGNVYGLEANKSGIEDLKNNFLVEKMITI